MIGTTTAFTLVDMGCRQSPRGCINVKERKHTLRAGFGPIAENPIAVGTVPLSASYTTHLCDKREQQGKELNGEYDHEVHRPIPQDDFPKARYPSGSKRQRSLGLDKEDQECRDIYNAESEKFWLQG